MEYKYEIGEEFICTVPGSYISVHWRQSEEGRAIDRTYNSHHRQVYKLKRTDGKAIWVSEEQIDKYFASTKNQFRIKTQFLGGLNEFL